MSLSSSHKDQILLHEGVKSKRRKCSDPDKADEQNFSFQSLVASPPVFLDICFSEYDFIFFWNYLQNFSLWSQRSHNSVKLESGKS